MNENTKRQQLVHEEINSAYNHHVIVERFAQGRARDLSDEPKVNGTPAIIIGSGPSLDDLLPFLKGWKGGIFCSTSHARTLIHAGIEPTHIVVLDPFCRLEEIEGVDWSKTRTKLVTHVGVWPDLIEAWPNEMLLYIQNNGRQDSFYATTQKRMYSKREGIRSQARFEFLVRTNITLFACSPPCELFVAGHLGYGACFLAGVDFGFTPEKARFTEWVPGADGEWKPIVTPFAKTENTIVSNNGVYTEPIHLYYKKNMISAWRLSGQTVYSMDHGIITEIPKARVEKVVENQGRGFPAQSKEWIAKITDSYLASVGAYVIETGNNGKLFIESDNPVFEIPQAIADIMRHYHCPKCAITATANDLTSYVGAPCQNTTRDGQRCDGTMERDTPIDANANIDRIYALWRRYRDRAPNPTLVRFQQVPPLKAIPPQTDTKPSDDGKALEPAETPPEAT